MHERRWLAAERIVSALIHAAHALPPSQREPTRESHSEHLRRVNHFAVWMREARADRARLGLSAVPHFSAGMVRVMLSRGVLPQEVEAAL